MTLKAFIHCQRCSYVMMTAFVKEITMDVYIWLLCLWCRNIRPNTDNWKLIVRNNFEICLTCNISQNKKQSNQYEKKNEFGTNQSVACRVSTLFTKSVKVWNKGFNWPVGVECLYLRQNSWKSVIKLPPAHLFSAENRPYKMLGRQIYSLYCKMWLSGGALMWQVAQAL